MRRLHLVEPLALLALLLTARPAAAAPQNEPDEPRGPLPAPAARKPPLAPAARKPPLAPVAGKPPPAPVAGKPPPAARKSVVAPKAAKEAGNARPARLFRFDALRIEGLAGPNALVLRTLDHGRRGSLLRYRRSFLRRILTTLEAPIR